MDREILVGETYKHFKGNEYLVLYIAYDAESPNDDLKKVVVYQALYGDYKIWIRDYDMFNSLVDKNKYPNVEQKYRFEHIIKDKKMEDNNGISKNI